ncbi:hypothetical protein CC78DRAFT_540625 [Lojkania enalia]|uniref:Uncharacterized protein n=1 Tax=Lojkania enalia TaxID=147567 RepID=A0A9P4KHF7_9PLEO|nr:hypothetical protein CC78DRAFT_540625 [Didymosphaeria enalia]
MAKYQFYTSGSKPHAETGDIWLDSSVSSHGSHPIRPTSFMTISDPLGSSCGSAMTRPTQRGVRKSKVNGKKRLNTLNPPGYFCFSLSGDSVAEPRRSAFSPCSGDNPCKRCREDANVAAGSKALMWMDCVRYTFEDVNIFETDIPMSDAKRARHLAEEVIPHILKNTYGNPRIDRHSLSETGIESSNACLVRNINQDNDSGLDSNLYYLITSPNSAYLIHEATAVNLGINVSLLLTTGIMIELYFEEGWESVPIEDLLKVRNYAACQVLSALEKCLKPRRLETSPSKLTYLKSLFIIICITIGAAVSTYELTPAEEIGEKEVAFARLLLHYFIYLSTKTSLLEQENIIPMGVLSREEIRTWSRVQTSVEEHIREQREKGNLDGLPKFKNTSSIRDDFRDLNPLSELTACSTCGTMTPFLEDYGHCEDYPSSFGMEGIEMTTELFGTVGTADSTSIFDTSFARPESFAQPTWGGDFLASDYFEPSAGNGNMDGIVVDENFDLDHFF